MVFSQILKSCRPQKLIKSLQRGLRLHFKDLNLKFRVKIRDTHKIEKKSISVFGYENEGKKYPIYQKNFVKQNMLTYYWQDKEKKHDVLIDSCMVSQYILEENIFVVIVYILSLEKKY